jgi:hypothetical protein
MNLNCQTTLFGVIFGFILAKRLDSPSLHVFIVFMSQFAMICLENWSSQKFKEKREILGIIKGFVFLVMSLVAASLYIKIKSIDFFSVAFVSALFAMGVIYFPTV